jgi:serine/threonine protein kinase
MSNEVLIIGNVTMDEVAEALRMYYGDKRNVMKSDGVLNAEDQQTDEQVLVMLQECSPMVKSAQQNAEKIEARLLDEKHKTEVTLESIKTFHKQQKDLFDEFVLLRQRYDDQKNTLVHCLWSRLGKHHPDLVDIPQLEDDDFVENESRVGKYSVGEVLGEGQFAIVKSCRTDDCNVDLAMKTITKREITTFAAIRRISNEISTLKYLQSKFVVNIWDAVHTTDSLYIIAEKGGRDLFEFFDEHPNGVSEEWAREIGTFILRAVLFCHERGICHRDLKPENILIIFDAGEGTCHDLKLCDFGLSLAFEKGSRKQLEGFCGSPGFFAPEMILREKYDGDKVDIWSSGAILLELVMGHNNFCDAWMGAYDYEVIQDPPKFEEEIKDTVKALPGHLEHGGFSPDLIDFLLGMLTIASTERPSTREICEHPWLGGGVDDMLAADFFHRLELEINTEIEMQDIGSPDGSSSNGAMSENSPMARTNSARWGRNGKMRQFVTPVNRTRSETKEWHNVNGGLHPELSNRERKKAEQYNLSQERNNGDLRLPPIEPQTPSLGIARKILKKGDELADDAAALGIGSDKRVSERGVTYMDQITEDEGFDTPSSKGGRSTPVSMSQIESKLGDEDPLSASKVERSAVSTSQIERDDDPDENKMQQRASDNPSSLSDPLAGEINSIALTEGQSDLEKLRMLRSQSDKDYGERHGT